MRIGAKDALSRSLVARAAALVRTKLAAVSGTKHQVEPVIGSTGYLGVEGVSQIVGVVSRGMLASSIEDCPRVDQHPRAGPLRPSTKKANVVTKLLKRGLCVGDERADVPNPWRDQREIVNAGVRRRIEDISNHHHAMPRVFALSAARHLEDVGVRIRDAPAPAKISAEKPLVEPAIDHDDIDPVAHQVLPSQLLGIDQLPGRCSVAEYQLLDVGGAPIFGLAGGNICADNSPNVAYRLAKLDQHCLVVKLDRNDQFRQWTRLLRNLLNHELPVSGRQRYHLKFPSKARKYGI